MHRGLAGSETAVNAGTLAGTAKHKHGQLAKKSRSSSGSKGRWYGSGIPRVPRIMPAGAPPRYRCVSYRKSCLAGQDAGSSPSRAISVDEMSLCRNFVPRNGVGTQQVASNHMESKDDDRNALPPAGI